MSIKPTETQTWDLIYGLFYSSMKSELWLLTEKNPSMSSTWPTPPKDIYVRPSFDPHTLAKAQKFEKGLKNP